MKKIRLKLFILLNLLLCLVLALYVYFTFLKTSSFLVVTDPPGATIYLNDSLITQKTPTEIEIIKPLSKQFIRLELDGYENTTIKTNLLSSLKKTVSVDLKPLLSTPTTSGLLTSESYSVLVEPDLATQNKKVVVPRINNPFSVVQAKTGKEFLVYANPVSGYLEYSTKTGFYPLLADSVNSVRGFQYSPTSRVGIVESFKRNLSQTTYKVFDFSSWNTKEDPLLTKTQITSEAYGLGLNTSGTTISYLSSSSKNDGYFYVNLLDLATGKTTTIQNLPILNARKTYLLANGSILVLSELSDGYVSLSEPNDQPSSNTEFFVFINTGSAWEKKTISSDVYLSDANISPSGKTIAFFEVNNVLVYDSSLDKIVKIPLSKEIVNTVNKQVSLRSDDSLYLVYKESDSVCVVVSLSLSSLEKKVVRLGGSFKGNLIETKFIDNTALFLSFSRGLSLIYKVD